MAGNLDNIIRGIIRGYGHSRGSVVPQTPSGAQIAQGNIGGRNARNRGTPAYPENYAQLAPRMKSLNVQDDEGFQVQSEPLDDEYVSGGSPGDLVNEMSPTTNEGKWLRGLAAAGALAAASPTSELPAPPPPALGFGDLTKMGWKDSGPPMTIEDFIYEASRETGVQPELIRAVMQAESAGDPRAVSRTGARGLMQLMPKTASEVGVHDPHDIRQGILGGARYLQKLANIYRGNLMKVVAAYNAGPKRIAHVPITEWPLETQEYLQQVLGRLPTKFRKVKYHPLGKEEMKQRSPMSPPATAMREGGPIDRMTGNTDLSGKQERTPSFDDAVLKNGGDPHDDTPIPEGLSLMIGAAIAGRLAEARQTRVAVTGGSFQPFHRGHAAVVRALAGSAPKVVVFVTPGRPFDHQLTMDLMRASLPDIWDRLEIYPAHGGLQASARTLAGAAGSTLNPESAVSVHPMPEDDEISSQRLRDALQDDEKDMVRKMLDPHVATQESQFEELYGRMRRELAGAGKKPAEVITAAPAPTPREGEIREMSAGAMATTVGDTRTGRHGGSAWSSYNPRNKGRDGDTSYQQFLRSPSTRMLDMTNSGVPNDHLPGSGLLNHHIDDPNDPDHPEELTDPTDLSDMIIRRLKSLS